MSTDPSARPEDGGDSSSRPPLRMISSSMAKQVRRKSSFILRGNSSDDFPSPHDSIFEAYSFSAANSDEGSNKVELVSISQYSLGAMNVIAATDENTTQLKATDYTLSVGDIEFRYGRGTVLGTITEQKSSNTMRTLAHTRSADDLPTVFFLNHCDSFELAKSPRRKQSFSVDDLALIQRYHEACAMIERETHKPLPLHEIYAQPKAPMYPPVHRPPTPPGMPSWTAAQSLPRQVRGPNNGSGVQNRLQRFLNLPASGITLPSRVPSRSSSTPLPNRIAPRFRPPRSAYGPIDRHPFLNAPIAKVGEIPPSAPLVPPASGSSSGTQTGTRLPKPTGKRKLGKRVRFTPSATARDSEIISLQTAMMTTSTSAVHPLDSVQISPDATYGPPTPRCPHRKGRREALRLPHGERNLNHDDVVLPSNEFLLLTNQSPPQTQTSMPIISLADPASLPSSRNTSLTAADSACFDSQPTRATSYSSTAHLIPRVPISSSPTPSSVHPNGPHNVTLPKEPWCWKCSLEKGMNKIDHWWRQSSSCFCLICFGIDVDDDMNLSRDVGHSSHHGMPGGLFRHETVGPRRVVLEQTPVTF
ncbi:hypothetical protein NA56DRAFT_698536 [Hyaloscypha hepaticicola]|uniref:Uncharacterized protein n=1 Tax=Hyaloscypha hepaticicola TaxID=2082293 RepID=A0A2J6QJD1_9HELO|nr:hypothetical protein NA56DRAFT_698536 [Hyaloscypha hepaticicola]